MAYLYSIVSMQRFARSRVIRERASPLVTHSAICAQSNIASLPSCSDRKESEIARDQRSVLLKGPSNVGWWLRNDAGEVGLEASVHFRDGRPMRTSQVVLRGRLRADRGGRVPWKLTMAEEG